jgi:hypothetical protein
LGIGALLAALSINCGGSSQRAAEPAADNADGAPVDWFVDRAAESGLDFVHVNGMTGAFYYPEVIPPGVALFDYDGDDDLDVFVAQGHSLSPTAPAASGNGGALFRNDGPDPLRFTNVTQASGLAVRGYAMGAAAGDYDNDGCVDLYVTSFGASQLFRNGCNGTFADVTRESRAGSPGWSVSAAFADVDRDGWLDLFVGHYLHYSVAANVPCYSVSGQTDYCPPHVYRAQPSRLLRNNRDGTFSDATTAAGLTAFGAALGVATADFNGDGWIDIYVANDGTPNHLWINQRGFKFRDTALLAGAAVSPEGLAKASMGVDAGDLDNDGDEDLFITELAGQGADLYVNDGTGSFTDEAPRSGLRVATLPFTGFGAGWFDFDNDGWLDLAAVNGAVTHTAEALARNERFALQQRRQLLRNLGHAGETAGPGTGIRFEQVGDKAGAGFRAEEVGRGAAFGDVDNDGDTDVVVANANGPVRLLVNTVGSQQSWAGLRLVPRHARRDALGARVRITRGDGRVLWRRARADGSYASANDPRVLAGLGSTGGPIDVQVQWPDGAAESWRGIPARRYTTLTQGSGEAASGDRFR